MKKLLLLFVFLFSLSLNVFAYDNIPVLMYHNTDYIFSEEQALSSISPEMFESHLSAFKEKGYNAISVSDYVTYFTTGKRLPENPFIITFDDGYLSNYTYAYPLLKKYDMKAAIFIVTGMVGVSDTAFPHFDWDVAAEMKKSGYIEIYSHTNSHTDLSTLTDAQTQFELRRSKLEIERNIGINCDVFAAPYGMFNQQTVNIADGLGYKLMMRVGTIAGENTANGVISLRRHTVTGDMTAEDVLYLMENE